MLGLIIAPFHFTQEEKRHYHDRVHVFKKSQRDAMRVDFSHVKGYSFQSHIFEVMGDAFNGFVEIKNGIYRFERKLPVVFAGTVSYAAILAAERAGVAMGMVIHELFYAFITQPFIIR
jgi:UDP-N-acetylmuramyl pentapeptide synthase